MPERQTNQASGVSPAEAKPRIVYCRCAYARVVPRSTKDSVLQALSASDVDFEAVPDLCEMSARKDPRLREIATSGSVKIAACFPRAVRWLFSAAEAPLPPEGIEVLNMREQPADDVVRTILPAADPSSEGVT